jgi:hypothetical protein
MRDEALTTPPHLSNSEAAVLYLLKRIRVDADLRYHMLGTEAFERLCSAEALRAGKLLDDIIDLYSTPADHCRDDKPRLPETLAGLEELVKLQAHYARLLNQYDMGNRTSFTSAGEWLARLRELAAKG